VRSPVGQSGQSTIQGVDGLVRQKDRVTAGFGELLDAGRDVEDVADQSNSSLLPPPMVPAITACGGHPGAFDVQLRTVVIMHCGSSSFGQGFASGHDAGADVTPTVRCGERAIYVFQGVRRRRETVQR